MIIQLTPSIEERQRHDILNAVKAVGWSSTEVKTQSGHYLVCIGSKDFDIRMIGKLSGVSDVHRVSDAYKLVSRRWKVDASVIDLGDGVSIQEGDVSLMAGPCSVESESQLRATAAFLQSNGVKILRGGAFKPRSSPYSFRGLGFEGLRLMHSVAQEYGLKVISEVLDASHIEGMYPYVDIYQVGTRNSQNFSLLHELGKVRKPVLIKRGMSGTLEELLQSAEYVFSSGNEALLLCERGIRTFEKAYRNVLDLNAVPYLKEKSHLPVIVDPSHGIGVRRYVVQMALAAVMAGADGLLVEIHEKPEEAASDGQQTLSFEEAGRLFHGVAPVLAAREANAPSVVTSGASINTGMAY
jgi:3-deoxy-7-phosphoheptulonate synthase